MSPEYDRGVDAKNKGVRRRENPYPVGYQEWMDWRDGWDDAADNLVVTRPQEKKP